MAVNEFFVTGLRKAASILVLTVFERSHELETSLEGTRLEGTRLEGTK